MEISGIDNIKKYLQLFYKKRSLFVITAISITTVFIIGSYLKPKKYEGKSTVLIEHNVISEFIKGITISPSMEERIRMLKDTILSRSVILNTLRKIDLASKAENNIELEGMIIDFQERTKLKVRKGKLFTILFRDKDPKLAMDYVNTLVKTYIEGNIFSKKEEAQNASRFLREQVGFFKNKMDRNESDIVKFRQEKGIYVMVNERSLVREIMAYGSDIEKIEIKRNELIATKQSLKRYLKAEDPFMVTEFTDGLLDRKDQMTESLENRLRQLLTTYTEDYPEVIKLRDEIASLKKQNFFTKYPSSQAGSETGAGNPIYQEIKQKIIEIEAEINSLNAKESHLKALIKEKKTQLKFIPEDKKKLADLEKENETYKETYKKLLLRLGQSEISERMESIDKGSKFKIIEPAILPTMPVGKSIKVLILAGIMFGLFGGFGIVFLLDGMDNSVKTVDTIKTLGLPVLAIIPKIQSAEDLIKIRKKDKLLYSFSGVYMLCILGLFTLEYMGLTYVDGFVQQIRGIF